MDPTHFRNGMNLLAAAFDRGQLNERQVALRYESYERLFAGDDGREFEAACVVGTQTAWRFFPAPVEIREQMAEVRRRVQREQERVRYEALTAEARRRLDEDTERRLGVIGTPSQEAIDEAKEQINRLVTATDPHARVRLQLVRRAEEASA